MCQRYPCVIKNRPITILSIACLSRGYADVTPSSIFGLLWWRSQASHVIELSTNLAPTLEELTPVRFVPVLAPCA